MSEINKKTLEHLAELARIDLKAGEEVKLQKDLGNILNYFKELQGVNTDGVEPMAGGTELKNITREDIAGKTDDAGEACLPVGRGAELFPDKKDGYLKVPPVF